MTNRLATRLLTALVLVAARAALAATLPQDAAGDPRRHLVTARQVPGE